MTEPITIFVTGAGHALGDVWITLYLAHSGIVESIDMKVDSLGRAVYVPPLGGRLICLLVRPPSGYWPMVSYDDVTEARIDCPALPMAGPLGWWHAACGVTRFDTDAGRGVRIGIVDTGAAPHQALSHAIWAGDFAATQAGPGEEDIHGHGTHVAGIIGGRPVELGAYGGVAPGASLLVARAFGREEQANNADVADAIESLTVDHRADLINLSLGSDAPSRVVLDAIRGALENGSLCLAAAGNDGAAVHYPAAFEEVVAVGALGCVGWGPPGSHAATYRPNDREDFTDGGFYVATFSSRGPQIDTIAPGVGLISTAPTLKGVSHGYSPMSGTSMAAPMACAVLARRLALDEGYLAMPRTVERADAARRLLESSLVDLGLHPSLQGRGVPRV